MKGLVGDVGSLKKKRSLTPDVLKVSESSFQILFVTKTLICLNKISPGRKIDTINSELFCWEKPLTAQVQLSPAVTFCLMAGRIQPAPGCDE